MTRYNGLSMTNIRQWHSIYARHRCLAYLFYFTYPMRVHTLLRALQVTQDEDSACTSSPDVTIPASASGALDFSTGFSVCMFPVTFIVQSPHPHAKGDTRRTLPDPESGSGG
jgi:hypothetical protein